MKVWLPLETSPWNFFMFFKCLMLNDPLEALLCSYLEVQFKMLKSTSQRSTSKKEWITEKTTLVQVSGMLVSIPNSSFPWQCLGTAGTFSLWPFQFPSEAYHSDLFFLSLLPYVTVVLVTTRTKTGWGISGETLGVLMKESTRREEGIVSSPSSRPHCEQDHFQDETSLQWLSWHKQASTAFCTGFQMFPTSSSERLWVCSQYMYCLEVHK